MKFIKNSLETKWNRAKNLFILVGFYIRYCWYVVDGISESFHEKKSLNERI